MNVITSLVVNLILFLLVVSTSVIPSLLLVLGNSAGEFEVDLASEVGGLTVDTASFSLVVSTFSIPSLFMFFVYLVGVFKVVRSFKVVGLSILLCVGLAAVTVLLVLLSVTALVSTIAVSVVASVDSETYNIF